MFVQGLWVMLDPLEPEALIIIILSDLNTQLNLIMHTLNTLDSQYTL